MPMNRALYPSNWNEIAHQIKTEADWTCQQCQRPCRRPGEDDQDLIDRISELPDWADDLYETEETEEFGAIDVPKLGRFTLTVAHLNHRPEDCRPENLAAWCSVCHCRYDLQAIPLKRQLKREREGQLTLNLEDYATHSTC
ncbi:HNH endonuclease [Leptolyngbya ohadii]|uniref:HNH endonuclease n=1 Tax=Leptolyngbya ohadii TaxID=1962290 RepID=UPI000B59B594|nr:HNH endonuclease [Leptolyngbya ohadii]